MPSTLRTRFRSNCEMNDAARVWTPIIGAANGVRVARFLDRRGGKCGGAAWTLVALLTIGAESPAATAAIILAVAVAMNAALDGTLDDSRRFLLFVSFALLALVPGFDPGLSRLVRLDEAAALEMAARQPGAYPVIATQLGLVRRGQRHRFYIFFDVAEAAFGGSAIGGLGGGRGSAAPAISAALAGCACVIFHWRRPKAAAAELRPAATRVDAAQAAPTAPAPTAASAPAAPGPAATKVDAHDGRGALSEAIDGGDSHLAYLPSFFTSDEAGALFADLEGVLARVTASQERPPKDSSAQSGRAQFYGAGTLQHSSNDTAGLELRANPRWRRAAWRLEGEELAPIQRIWSRVEEATQRLMPTSSSSSSRVRFNSVLVNRYASGMSGIKWHCDAEKCYGDSSDITIASVSLGAARSFLLRRKPQKQRVPYVAEKRSIVLRGGSLLVMAGEMQEQWQHSLEANAACTECRINLTFRWCRGEYEKLRV